MPGRLDNNIVVLRGSEEDAPGQLVKGTVVLCLSEPLSVKNPRRARPIQDQSVFFLKNFTFKDVGKGRAEVLEMGNYEFPFEILLPGNTPETVEGLFDCWIQYTMKATIARGRLANSLHARKNLRVVRTLAPNSLELSHAMSVENIWPDKLEYAINIPCKAVIFGTCIKIDLTLIPLLKGLRIGKILVQLQEAQEFILYNNIHMIARRIASAEYNIPSDSETLGEDQAGFRLHERLTLPRTLRRCVQDVHCKGVKVRHKLVFSVQLHNPDGHLSELRASLPVYLFISPHLPIGEDGNIVDGNPNDPRTLEALDQHAPPLYGDHEFDVLWDHLDPGGYVPTGSVSSASSRNRDQSYSPESADSTDSTESSTLGSREMHDNPHDPPDPGSSVLPNNTYSDASLHPSQVSEAFTRETLGSPGLAQGASDREGNPSCSNLSSLQNSTEMGPAHTVEHAGIDAIELSRVPSYTAAIRSTARTLLHDDLPTYFSATGNPLPPSVEMPQLRRQTRAGRLERCHSAEVSRSPALLNRATHRHTLLVPTVVGNSALETPTPLSSTLPSRGIRRGTLLTRSRTVVGRDDSRAPQSLIN
ncbi:MAG: hypothetical protein M1839_005761 [Geoglossum umbratile]|nr:MAG: hypothetical protein M1839_005761 [Geoglossum umbratile]